MSKPIVLTSSMDVFLGGSETPPFWHAGAVGGRLPHHWKTTTFVGALRQDGLVAPCAFDGSINGEKFRAWIEQFLVPELRAGDLVILDNLPSHKVKGVRAPIENVGDRLLYLPSCSPDLNPIEQWFAKLKALLRKAAVRTFDALIQAIAGALETFTADECANYLANSGYRRQ
jgi:transposase